MCMLLRYLLTKLIKNLFYLIQCKKINQLRLFNKICAQSRVNILVTNRKLFNFFIENK